MEGKIDKQFKAGWTKMTLNFISPALWIKDVSLDGQRMDKPIDGWKNARIVGLMDNCIMKQIK